MRLLLVAHNFPTQWPGGVENYTVALARALEGLGIEVSVLYPVVEQRDDIVVESAEELGLQVHRLRLRPPGPFGLHVSLPAVEQVFERLLREQQIDVVHFQHTWVGLPFSLPAVARAAGAVVCLTLHDFWFACARTHLFIERERRICSGPESNEKCTACLMPGHAPDPAVTANLAMRRTAGLAALDAADVVTAPSRFVADFYERYGVRAGQIEVSPIGIRPPVTRRVPHDGLVYGYLGAFATLKNPMGLLDAFCELDGPVRLELHGPVAPPSEGDLQSALRRDARVQHLGAYDARQVGDVLARLDVVVLPSTIETYSLVAREALACGVPVIAAAVGALPEAIEHEENGLLYDPEEPGALERALRRFRDEPELRSRLLSFPPRIHAIEQDAAQWQERYTNLLARRPTVAPARISIGDDVDCSVVVPVFNRFELTRACLDRLVTQPTRRSREIIVVDDGSTDGTEAGLAAFGEQIRVVRQGRNTGFANACNAGARAARSGRLLFLNNDTDPRLGWLDELSDELDADPGIGIAGSKLLYPDGRVQHAGVVFCKPVARPYHPFVNLPGNDPRVNRRRELQAVTGASFLIRRALFEEHGGFDPAYRNGFEDVDLCLKVGRAGARIVYQPRSVLVHLESQSPGRKAHEEGNSEVYASRWEDPSLVDEDRVLAADDLASCHVPGTSRMQLRPYSSLTPELRATWSTVVTAQRSAHGGTELAPLFERPECWPEDELALLYGVVLCLRHFGDVAAVRFLGRLRTTSALARKIGAPLGLESSRPGPEEAARRATPPAPDRSGVLALLAAL